MKKTSDNYTVSFSDPRFAMTLPGRFLVRVAGYIGNLLVIAATFTLVISPLAWLRLIGGFLFIMLVDRLAHWGEGDYPLSELPANGAVDASRYMHPKAFSAMERAFDKS